MSVIQYDNKTIKKKEKIEKDSKRSKTNIENARSIHNDQMKKSLEDLELWKQKEIAKGKDPKKVEIKYERGLKILDRLENRLGKKLDRLETRVDDWDFKGRVKLEKAARKKMLIKVATSSLAKMEKILTETPDSKMKYMIAAYASIVKKDKVNQLKHPMLSKEIINWENAIKKASKDDEYFKIFLSLIDAENKKDKRLAFKKETVKIVNDILTKEKISIRFLSEYTGIKYSNLYNFLRKDILTELSFRRTHLLLWSTKNFSQGWSKEEAISKHIKRMDALTDYWDDELINN